MESPCLKAGKMSSWDATQRCFMAMWVCVSGRGPLPTLRLPLHLFFFLISSKSKALHSLKKWRWIYMACLSKPTSTHDVSCWWGPNDILEKSIELQMWLMDGHWYKNEQHTKYLKRKEPWVLPTLYSELDACQILRHAQQQMLNVSNVFSCTCTVSSFTLTIALCVG